jgi:hypothetical protein
MTWDGSIAAMGSFTPESPTGGWISPSSTSASDFDAYSTYVGFGLYPGGWVYYLGEIAGVPDYQQKWGQFLNPTFYDSPFIPAFPGGDPESDPLPLTDYEWRANYISGDAIYYELTSAVPVGSWKSTGGWANVFGIPTFIPNFFFFNRGPGAGIGTSTGVYTFEIRKISDMSALVTSPSITINLETIV